MRITKVLISTAFLSILLGGCANGPTGPGSGGSGEPDMKRGKEIEVNFNKPPMTGSAGIQTIRPTRNPPM